LAFNKRKNFTKAQEVKVNDRMLRLFARVQWNLFNSDRQRALKFVKEEWRRLGFPDEPISIAPISTARPEKRKAQVEKRGMDGNTGHKRRRTEVDEKSNNFLSRRADTSSPMPIPISSSDLRKPYSRSERSLHTSSNTVLPGGPSRTKGNQFHDRPGEGFHTYSHQRAADWKDETRSISSPRKKGKHDKAAPKRRIANVTAQPDEHPGSSILTTPSTIKDSPRDKYTNPDTTAQELAFKHEPVSGKDSDGPSISIEHAVPEIFSPIVETSTIKKATDESPSEATELPLLNGLHNWLREPVEDALVSSVQVTGIEYCEETTPPVPSIKSPLCNYPPIWAQVIIIIVHLLQDELIFCDSLAKKFASPSIGFEVIKGAFITPVILLEDTFLAHFLQGWSSKTILLFFRLTF